MVDSSILAFRWSYCTARSLNKEGDFSTLKEAMSPESAIARVAERPRSNRKRLS
jgi:hypothetical protein